MWGRVNLHHCPRVGDLYLSSGVFTTEGGLERESTVSLFLPRAKSLLVEQGSNFRISRSYQLFCLQKVVVVVVVVFEVDTSRWYTARVTVCGMYMPYVHCVHTTRG